MREGRLPVFRNIPAAAVRPSGCLSSSVQVRSCPQPQAQSESLTLSPVIVLFMLHTQIFDHCSVSKCTSSCVFSVNDSIPVACVICKHYKTK